MVYGDTIKIYFDTSERKYSYKFSGTRLILKRNLKGDIVKDKDLIVIEEYKKSGHTNE